MGLQYSNISAAERPERGSILILTSVVLLGLLIFSGLAIDAGNLYRAQLAAQNAADSAALAMVNFVTTTGKLRVEQDALARSLPPATLNQRSEIITAYLAARAEQLARANMASAGFAHEPSRREVKVDSQFRLGDTSVNPGDPSFAYTVRVYRDVDYLILGSIPLINRKFSGVVASATSDRKVANVALLVDVSGSLGCPRSGDCSCLTGGGGACPATGRKFDDLIDAVRDFIQLFDLENDRVNLVPYNLAAKTISITELRAFVGRSGAVTDEEVDLIAEYLRTNWIPSGATNLCDAFIEAASTINRVAPEQSASYVVFSDGAPTAGRFLFAKDAVKPGLEKSNLGFGDYDYSMFTVDWFRDPATVENGEPAYYSGPSVLLHSANLISDKKNEVGVFLENPELPPRPDGAPRCNDGLSAVPKVTGTTEVGGAVKAVLDPCLSSMKSHLPGDPLRTYGSQYASKTASAAHMDWRKQYYHCAIEMADFLRSSRQATVYAIGLGDPATPSSTGDAYGNINDSLKRKDVFLSRVALDLKTSNSLAPVDGSGAPQRQEFDYTEYRDYADLTTASKRQYGLYLPTHDSTDLRLMFQQIARKLLLRLIS